MTNRGKGPGGMTIKQAIRQVITRLRRATGNDIHKEVKAIYGWGNHAILRHIMGQTINLQPGYYEWVYVKQGLSRVEKNTKCHSRLDS